jgi:hypothetical protein
MDLGRFADAFRPFQNIFLYRMEVDVVSKDCWGIQDALQTFFGPPFLMGVFLMGYSLWV